MTTEYYIALQEPSVKLLVKSRQSVAGTVATVGVEFLLHSQTVGDQRKAVFEDILYSEFDVESWKKNQGRKVTKAELNEAHQQFLIENSNKLKALIKQEIVNLYDIPVQVKKGGELQSVVFPTISEFKTELLGDKQSEKEALAFLLDSFLDSAPWSSAFTQKIYEVWQNLSTITDEQEAKNS